MRDKCVMEYSPAIKTIHRLPIQIGYLTDFSSTYIVDRKAAQTPGALKDLVRRWQALWQIPYKSGWKPGRNEKLLVSRAFDAEDVLRCIKKNSPQDPTYRAMCKHMKPGKSCISTYIILPPLLLQIGLIANHFKVPEGTAFIQLQRSIHPELSEMDDPDVFNSRFGNPHPAASYYMEPK